jgi:endonuclease YncB( thermonuclease family)
MHDYPATILAILDADTLKIDADLGVHTHAHLTIRLAGINAPELHTTEGKAAKDAAQTWLNGATLLVQTIKADEQEKYGRWLGVIYRNDDPQSLNAYLIQTGHAVAYNGGKR